MQIPNGSPVQGFCSPDGNMQRQKVGKKYRAASLFPGLSGYQDGPLNKSYLCQLASSLLENVAPVYTSFL